MLEKLIDKSLWQEFLDSKLNNDYLSKFDKKDFSDFISNDKYLDICNKIIKCEYSFSIPKKHVISKNKSSKRRIVYSFNSDEMIIMKYISYLLYEYDYLFASNLYSFRRHISVRHAVNKLSHISKIKRMYGYKLDISNYFNSVDISIFLEDLKENVTSDIYELYKSLYTDSRVYSRGKLISENKGAMAGVPLSSFSANFYIREIDHYFEKNHIVYFRYADDIIFFCDSNEQREEYVNKLKSFLSEKKLTVNKEKETYIEPHDYFEFLGFSFKNNKVDISLHSKRKIKAKVKRKARKLYRWKNKKGLTPEKALVAMNRSLNKKFFAKSRNETSWSYWYFPIINTSESLKEIDQYIQQEERYLFSGHHNKMNYKKCPYSSLKKYGYRSLVNEYYKFKNNK